MSDSDHSGYSSASSSGGNDAPNTDSVSSFLPHAKGSGTLSGDAHDAAFLQAAASHPSAESRSAAMFQTKWFGMRYVSEDSELHYCLYRYNDRRRNLFVTRSFLHCCCDRSSLPTSLIQSSTLRTCT
jgi:hypothetical protein